MFLIVVIIIIITDVSNSSLLITIFYYYQQSQDLGKNYTEVNAAVDKHHSLHLRSVFYYHVCRSCYPCHIAVQSSKLALLTAFSCLSLASSNKNACS